MPLSSLSKMVELIPRMIIPTQPLKDGVIKTRKMQKLLVLIHIYERVSPYNEKALQKAVASQPIISIGMEGSGKAFQFYTSGIFTGECGKAVDHGMLIVGYGTENDKDYWIVRNSWGKKWGEEGYMRMERNVASSAGLCGLAVLPSYPVKNGQNPGPTRPESVSDE